MQLATLSLIGHFAVLPVAICICVPTGPLQETSAQEDFLPIFEEVTNIVEEYFYDPAKLDTAWKHRLELTRVRIKSVTTRADFESIMNNLLQSLNASHTNYFGLENPKRYQLLGIFNQLFDSAQSSLFVYDGIGISTARSNGEFVVDSVFDGFPAQQAGLRFGDVIQSVNDEKFRPIVSFRSKQGQSVKIKILRGEHELNVECDVQRLDGRVMFEKALLASRKTIKLDGKKIGYLHAWSYAGTQFQEIIRSQLLWGELSQCEAFVLDLRDGWGGADINYLNLFRPPIAQIQSIDRKGKALNFTGTWNKPVVLVANERTTSGKELLCYGFKKMSLGKIVGKRTAGAVLAGRCFLLSNGDVLYLAVSKVIVDERELEGTGVEPDIPVDRPFNSTSSRDPQLDAALKVLSEKLKLAAPGK